MSKIITVTNQKGGVAKTTTTAALAAGLKKRGYKVLAVDFDPQGNLSSGVNISPDCRKTIYEVLKWNIPAKEAIQEVEEFDIIPANIILAGIEHELVQIGKEYRLEQTLKPVIDLYDYIIIDTPPSLGILTTNALMIADDLIIPTTPSLYAAIGMEQLKLFINSILQYRKRQSKLTIAGILITKHNQRTNVSRELAEYIKQLADLLETKVFDTSIRFSIKVEEAQATRSDILKQTRSNVADDYNAFIDEYLKGENK